MLLGKNTLTLAQQGTAARLRNARTHEWMHPLGDIVGVLGGAGLALEWLPEHPRVSWQMFKCVVCDADGLLAWPDRPWLPLAYSLSARKGGPPGAVAGRADTSV